MKIAVTTTGDTLNSSMDMRFGRAKKFILYNTESQDFQVYDNTQNLNAAQGAGIQAAQNIAATGAKAVITGHVGPKAFAVLNQAGIKIYNTDASTVIQALEKFSKNEISAINNADVEGHWV
jgi:predicted Fe-Mo cluster-binding NifX family protein